MQKLIRLTLSSGFFILLTCCPISLTQAEEISSLSNKLQNALNSNRKIDFSNFFSKEISKDIKKKYNYFLDAFPNAKWIINTPVKLKENLYSLEILISGEKDTGIHQYSLTSNQKLGIKTEGERITGIEVLSDYSILQSGSNLIEITPVEKGIKLTIGNKDFSFDIESAMEIADAIIEAAASQEEDDDGIIY